MATVLLLGRKAIIVDELAESLGLEGYEFQSGTSIEDAKDLFSKHEVDIVIMGAGLPLEDRLDIVRYIFENSASTQVHMKDWDSGPEGMTPFVKRILEKRI